MTTDPAVTAATQAIEFEIHLNLLMAQEGNLGGGTDQRGLASVAVAAARPIILGLDRAAIAAALDDVDYDVPVPDGYIDTDYRAGFDAGIRYALTIVGGDSE